MKLCYKVILIVLIIGFLTALAFLYRDFGSFQQAAISVPTFDKPISEMSIEELQAKIIEIKNAIIQFQALLMQITGPDRITQEIPSDFLFKRNLISGLRGIDVKYLQIILNSYPDTQVAETGYGSPGYETIFFGWRTRQAVLRFQQKYWREISLITKYQGVGFVEYQTRSKLNSLLTEYQALAVPLPTPTPTPTPLPPDSVPPTPLPSSPVDICGEDDSICPLDCHYQEDLDCSYCGDHTIQNPNDDYQNEVCDGLDLGGETCISQGYDSGELSCSSDCSRFVFHNCSAVLSPPVVKITISPETIIPKLQNIEMLSSMAVEIDSSWKIAVDLNNQDESFTASYLRDKILGTSLAVNIEIVDINSSPQNKRIVIGNPNSNSTIAQIASSKGININSELRKGFNQGYILSIEPEEILIVSKSAAGAFYGAVSLTWLLRDDQNSIVLPNTKITDWPDLEIRGFFGLKKTGYSREEWIDFLAMYKYNMWVQGIPWVSYSSSSSRINSSLKIKDYLVKRHFHPTLSLEPLTAARYYNPNLQEGIYAYNIPMEFNETDYAVSSEEDNFQLNNAGFENDGNKDGMPDYWKSHFSKRSGNWIYDCSVSHSGNCSIRLTVLKNLGEIETSPYLYSSDLSSQERSFYDLNPDKTYILSFWAKKIENVSSSRNPEFLIEMQNPANGENYYLVRSIGVNNQWEKYKIVLSTASGYTKMRIRINAQGINTMKFWLDDIEIMDLTDKLFNVIKTSDTRLHIFNKERTVEYVENQDYQLIETGDFNVIDPDKGKQTKIKRISTGNIPENGEIRVDYDFIVVFAGNIWNSFSDPSFLELYENSMVKPSMTNLKPEFVFINIDEIADINRDSRSKKRGLENYQVLANFVNKISKIIKSYDSNIRIITWDDMYNPFHYGGTDYQTRHGSPSGKMWYSLDLLDRDLIQLSWWYNDRDYSEKMRMSPLLFNRYGFQFLGGPAVYTNNDDSNRAVLNIKKWSHLSYKYNALGMIAHSFYDKWDEVDTAANYSWNAIKQYTGCNPDYIEICDGIDNDCDNTYWSAAWKNITGPSNIDEGFDLSNDPFNCGTCGNICYYPNAYFSCVNGGCRFNKCYEFYYNDNNSLSDGCEAHRR